jgi:hypothetical protein
MFIQHLLITILLTCCSFVIDNVNVGYFHNVFRFVFVCNVFWVEFQQRRRLQLLLRDVWLLLQLLGEREDIGGIVT